MRSDRSGDLAAVRVAYIEAAYHDRPMTSWGKAYVDKGWTRMRPALVNPSPEHHEPLAKAPVTAEIAQELTENLICVHLYAGTHAAQVEGRPLAEAAAMLRPRNPQLVDRLFEATRDAEDPGAFAHHATVLVRALAQAPRPFGLDFIMLSRDILLRFTGLAEAVSRGWTNEYMRKANEQL